MGPHLLLGNKGRVEEPELWAGMRGCCRRGRLVPSPVWKVEWTRGGDDRWVQQSLRPEISEQPLLISAELGLTVDVGEVSEGAES